jgi:hypothetical protein
VQHFTYPQVDIIGRLNIQRKMLSHRLLNAQSSCDACRIMMTFVCEEVILIITGGGWRGGTSDTFTPAKLFALPPYFLVSFIQTSHENGFRSLYLLWKLRRLLYNALRAGITQSVYRLVAGSTTGDHFSVGVCFFRIRNILTGSGAQPFSSPVGNGGDFTGIKRLGGETVHSPPSNAQVINDGVIALLPDTPS